MLLLSVPMLLAAALLASVVQATTAALTQAAVIRSPLKTFDVSTTVLNNFDRISVSFAFDASDEEESLNSDDWIGVYCIDSEAASDDIAVDDYIDQRRTKYRAADTLTFGPMVNMRCAWQFRFVTESNEVLAISPFVRFAKGNEEPVQIHLAATSAPTEMRATWTSSGIASSPVIRYGLSNDSLTLSVQVTATTYEAGDMCSIPAMTEAPRLFRNPGQIYTGVMKSLAPDTTYFYRVGDSSGLMSDVMQFVAPPASGSATPTSFVVFGDLVTPTSATSEFRVPGASGTTMALIEKDIASSTRSYVAVFHVGDLSYARGATYLWDQFGFLIQGVASRVAYMIGVGNHDYGYLEGKFIDTVRFPSHPLYEDIGTSGFDSGGECGVPALKRFPMPQSGNSPFWYSTEMGLAHHTVLSSEHDFRADSPMYSWLVSDLRDVNRTRTPWLFLHIHRPFYCSEMRESDYERSVLLRNHVEHLLNEYRVDVVFSGHSHTYERTCPVYDEKCYYGDTKAVAHAPVHILVGTAGAKIDSEGYDDSHDWSLAAAQEHGYGRVHIYNASHLQLEFVSNELAAVKDSAWIVSNHSWPNTRARVDRSVVANSSEIAFIGLGALVMLIILFLLRNTELRRKEAMSGISQSSDVEAAKKVASSPEHDVTDGLLRGDDTTAGHDKEDDTRAAA